MGHNLLLLKKTVGDQLNAKVYDFTNGCIRSTVQKEHCREETSDKQTDKQTRQQIMTPHVRIAILKKAL